YGHKKVEAVVNLPIQGDELAARFAARYNDRDGYGDYKGYTDPDGFFWNGLDREASDVEKNTYVRGKIKWQPADHNFSATLGVDWSDFEDSGQRSEVMGINPAFGTGAFIFGAIGFNPANFLAQQKFGDAYWNA